MKRNQMLSFVGIAVLTVLFGCTPFKSHKASQNPTQATRTISAVTGPIQSVVVSVTAFEIDFLNIDTDQLQTLVVQQNVGLVDLAKLESDGFPFTINDSSLPPTLRVRAIRFKLGTSKPVVKSEQGLCDWTEGANLTQVDVTVPADQNFDIENGSSYLMRATFEALNPQITGSVVLEKITKGEPNREVATYNNTANELKECLENKVKALTERNNCLERVKVLESQIEELKKELKKCKDARSCPADQCQMCKQRCEDGHNKGYGAHHRHDRRHRCNEQVDCVKKCEKFCPDDDGGGGGGSTGLVCSFTVKLTLVGFEKIVGGSCVNTQ